MTPLVDLFLMAGAIAWLSTAIVHKDGPANILLKFRVFAFEKFGTTVFRCTFCTGFWVGILVVMIWLSGYTSLISFFGILGLASAIRGASAEF